MKNKKGKIILSLLMLSISMSIFGLFNSEVSANADLPYWGEKSTDADYQPTIFTDEAVNEKIGEVGRRGDTEIKDFNGVDSAGVGFMKGKVQMFLVSLSAIIIGFAVIMVTFAGFKYATSEGDARAMAQAKTQIITAGIGIGLAVFNLIIVGLFKEILSAGI